MTRADWQRIVQLFQAALPLSRAARDVLFERECANDATMRAEIESLLKAHVDSGDFMQRPIPTVTASVEWSGLPPGTLLGAWRIVRPLGHGGMGEVHEAVRDDGQFRQRAAIKLIRLDAPELLQRFQTERQILARLDHPGIARLLDGGISGDGRPYAVMEYVEGTPITDYCRSHGAGVGERLRLFAQVCAAVADAHRNLIVHRDLKPSNILVDSDGRVRLLDFGIAKLLDPAAWSGGAQTRATQLPLTPDYCAPEQLTGETVTTGTDVYGLGLLLFELLTGKRPWQVGDQPLARAVRILLDTPAPRPSDIAGEEPTAALPARTLLGDLDAIVAMCLRREPSHRYETVSALRRDIERYLADQPVAARTGQRAYVAGRFLRRHRRAVAAVLALALALGAGLAGTVWQARNAQQQASRAIAVQDFLIDIFQANTSAQADPIKARQTSARNLLDLGAAKIESALHDTPQAKLALLDVLARLYDDLALPDEETQLREQAVDLVRELNGEDSTELAEALTALVAAMNGSKRTAAEREATLTQAEAILDRRGDFTSAARASLLRAQAEHYQIRDLQRALDYGRRSVALYSGLPESKDLAQAWYLRGLIETYSGLGEAARVSLDKAIDITQRLGGDRDPLLIVQNYQRAETMSWLGDFAGAELSARAALALALAINGEDHVDAARTRSKLAWVLFDSGRPLQALALHGEARDLILRIRGLEDTFHTPAILFAHGKMQARAGHLAAGRADLETALAIDDRADDRSLFAAFIREELARVLIETGRSDAAVVRLDEAWRIRAGIGQAEGTADFNGNRALRIGLALDNQRLGEARVLLAAYVVSPVAGVTASPSQLNYWLLDAEIALAEGSPAAAIASADRVRFELEKEAARPDLVPLLASANMLLGRAELAQGRAAAALPRLQQALSQRDQRYAPDSPRIAEAQILLADCLHELSRVKEAVVLLGRARAIHTRHPELAERYREPLRTAEARMIAVN